MNKPANDSWHPLNPVERFNLELLARQYERNVAILDGRDPSGQAGRQSRSQSTLSQFHQGTGGAKNPSGLNNGD